MKKVWKFTLHVDDYEQVLVIPAGARFVTARYRHEPGNFIDLWFEVNPEAPTEHRMFAVHGTGHPILDTETYVGTTFDDSLGLVWHVYETAEWDPRRTSS